MTNETAAQKVIDHLHANQEHFQQGLIELLRIPSVSTDPAYKADVDRCADWVVSEMSRIGLDNARKMPTAGHPVVYGEWLKAGADKPTALIYAHYDVQPVDPLALWTTPPFEPTVRDGKLYARGACDDKCGVWGTLKVLESMFAANGTLPMNVKVFCEGEEEIGSPNMEPFVVANKDMLDADLFILNDGDFKPNAPVREYALRGIVAAEVKVKGPGHDLHSGEFGGAVQNPLHVAGQIIGSFHDAAGRVTIPGFNDAVRPLPTSEKAALDAIWEPKLAELKARTGVSNWWAESLGSFAERTTAQPTLEVNGMWGGYQAAGSKTIIPAEAGFKVTMRIVPDQDPHEISRLFENYVQGFASDTITIETTVRGEGWHFTLDHEGPVADALNRAFEKVCGKTPRWTRVGGSVAIGGMFQHELGMPMAGLGMGAGDKYHAPDEFLTLADFQLAMNTLTVFLYDIADKLPVA